MGYESIHQGMVLVPLKRWNNTSGRDMQLPFKVKVLEVTREMQSQTGTMVRVAFTSGNATWLDAAWFKGMSQP